MSTDRARWSPTHLVVTCEHAGNAVPARYAHAFADAEAALASHRGWDIGALEVARAFASALGAPLIANEVTRLLVDCNRPPEHPALYSEFAMRLTQGERARAFAAHYLPHVGAVRRAVGDAAGAGRRVLHVGVHSFTDVLRGEVREVDVALLYDPLRSCEAAVCEQWRSAFVGAAPALRFAFNEPYHGADDGLTTTLRGEHPPDRYAGVEIEVRQGLLTTTVAAREIGSLLADSLRPLLRLLPRTPTA